MPALTPDKIAEIAKLMTRAFWPPSRWFPMSYSSAATAAGVDAGVVGEAQFVSAATQVVKQGLLQGAERAAAMGAIEAAGGAEAAAAATGITLASEEAVAGTILIGGIELTIGAALAAGLILVVAVVGAVVIVKKISSKGSSNASPPSATQPPSTDTTGGSGQSGDLELLGKIDPTELGPFLKGVRLPNNNVNLFFPAEGGTLSSDSRAHLRIEGFPWGTFYYKLTTGVACSLAGAATGGAGDCSDSDVPEEYRNCKSDFDLLFHLDGSYNRDAKTLSGQGQAESKALMISGSCPSGARPGGDAPGHNISFTWSGAFDGREVKGTIVVDSGRLPFNAIVQQ